MNVLTSAPWRSPCYLLAGDGDPLEAVLAHQVLEGQLQLDLAFGRAGGIAGAVGDGDLLQGRKMPVPTVRNLLFPTYTTFSPLVFKVHAKEQICTFLISPPSSFPPHS